jgi:UDP-glucose 4-epimerase
MKKILITGGAGFIGSNLAKKFKQLGHDVVIFDDFSTGKKELLAGMENEVEIIEGDVCDADKVRKAITTQRPDAIYHLAALHFIPDCEKDPEKARAINVGGTENVLQAAAELEKKPHLLFTSTSAVYKDSSEPFTESNPLEPIDAYGRAKLEGERLVQKYGGENKAPYTIVRPLNVYGPQNTIPSIITTIVSQLREGDTVTLGNLKPVRDFIFVEDFAEVFSKMFLEDKRGTYVLGTGRSCSIKEVTEIFEKLLKGVTFISKKELIRENDRMHLVGNPGKVKEEIGWEPTVTLEEGIARILKDEKMV